MTDEEWRVKVRDWTERIEKDTMKIVQYLYPELMKALREMKEASG